MQIDNAFPAHELLLQKAEDLAFLTGVFPGDVTLNFKAMANEFTSLLSLVQTLVGALDGTITELYRSSGLDEQGLGRLDIARKALKAAQTIMKPSNLTIKEE